MESNGKPKGNAKNIVAGILALVGAIGSGLLWLGFILAEGALGLLVILAVSMSEAEISDISTVLPFELYMTYFEININFLLPAFVAVFVLLATASFACLSRREQVKKTGIVLSVVGSALLLGCISRGDGRLSDFNRDMLLLCVYRIKNILCRGGLEKSVRKQGKKVDINKRPPQNCGGFALTK